MKQPYKVVILCGGLGTRLRAHAENVPKALVQIGGKPIIWHVMKLYSRFGFRDFILTLGYKGEMILNYFEQYCTQQCDYTLEFSNPKTHVFHTKLPEDEREWRITFAHTGLNTNTGGRIKRIEPYIAEEHFLATYTDGLSDVNIAEVLEKHLASGLEATMVSVNLPTTFGLVEAQDGLATRFREKPRTTDRINGGFFVFRRSIFNRISGDDVVLEEEPLQSLVDEGRVGVYQHDGFWQCMDTPKDAMALTDIWNSGTIPWKTWND